MRRYIYDLSTTTLLSLLFLVTQVLSLPQSTYVDRMENIIADNQEVPTYPGSTYEPEPGELNPVNIDFGKAILDGKIIGAVVPLRPEPDVPGSWTGYVSFGEDALSFERVTFTGGPEESLYTTLCMFYRIVDSNSGEMVPKVTEVFERGMEGSAVDVNGIGCAAMLNNDGGGGPGMEANVIEA